jgi:hypothetical protein
VAVTAQVSGYLHFPPRFSDGLVRGAEVRQGEALLSIENEAVESRSRETLLLREAAEAELETVRRAVDEGFRPQIDLRRQEVSSKLAVERENAAAAAVAALVLRAKVSGVLALERAYGPGTWVAAGTEIGEIAVKGPRLVETYATVTDLERLEPGLEVHCTDPREGGRLAVGYLREVPAEVDSEGVARAVVEVTEDTGLPPPGAGVDVSVLLRVIPDAVVVPERSVKNVDGRSTVVVLEQSGEQYIASERAVVEGARSGSMVQIVGGMRGDELVAVDGAAYLQDGDTVYLTEMP